MNDEQTKACENLQQQIDENKRDLYENYEDCYYRENPSPERLQEYYKLLTKVCALQDKLKEIENENP